MMDYTALDTFNVVGEDSVARVILKGPEALNEVDAFLDMRTPGLKGR